MNTMTTMTAVSEEVDADKSDVEQHPARACNQPCMILMP